VTECDHIVATYTNKCDYPQDMRQSEYESGGASRIFQDEMADFCWICGAEIDWESIHNKMKI